MQMKSSSKAFGGAVLRMNTALLRISRHLALWEAKEPGLSDAEFRQINPLPPPRSLGPQLRTCGWSRPSGLRWDQIFCRLQPL